MHLPRKIALLTAVVSTLSCHDSVAPFATPPTTYILNNVNGQPVPYVSPIPENPTIISGRLLLSTSGKATLIQRRTQMGVEVTDTWTYIYTIVGTQIAFGYDPPCGVTANCAAPPNGTITGSRVVLDVNVGTAKLVYDFQFYGPD